MGAGVVVFPQADVFWDDGSTTTIQGGAEVWRRDGPGGGGFVILPWPRAGHGIPVVLGGGARGIPVALGRQLCCRNTTTPATGFSRPLSSLVSDVLACLASRACL